MIRIPLLIPYLALSLLLVGIPVPGHAQEEEPKEKPTAKKLVEELGSPVFSKRANASRQLWKMGEAAIPALRDGAQSADPEVAERCKEILAKFAAGQFPDTPPELAEKIRRYRTATDNDKRLEVINELIKDRNGLRAWHTILNSPIPAGERAILFDRFCWLLRREVPRLLIEGKIEQAEELLALNCLGGDFNGLTDYAVFVTIYDRADNALANLETKWKSAQTEPLDDESGEYLVALQRALVFLYRAADRRDKAKEVARELAKDNPDHYILYDSLLEDLGDWSELADRAPLVESNSRDGLKLFRLSMAGRKEEAERVAENQKDAIVGEQGGYGGVDEATLALMLGGRQLDGIERMKQQRNLPHILADVLSARHQFDEALDLVGGAAGKRADEAAGYDTQTLKHLYGTRRGRLLAQLGERDAATQIFNQLATQLSSSRADEYHLTQLVRSEVRVGRYDLAAEHAGRVQALIYRDRFASVQDSFTSGSQDSFEAIFGTEAEAARYWWTVLRAEADEATSPGDIMKQVRRLMIGEAKPEEVDNALKASRTVNNRGPTDTIGYMRTLAVAALHRANRDPHAAIKVLSDAADRLGTKPFDDDDQIHGSEQRVGRGSRSWVFGTDERFRLWMDLGDLLMETNDPAEAARRYEQGWRRFPDNPILLYLAGKANLKAGDNEQGEKYIKLSHIIPLGNARMRGRFLEELLGRGEIADAKRERDLALEAGWLSERFLGNVWNQVARASSILKDFDQAADANRRAIHYLLRTPMVSYVEGFAYLTVPQAVNVYEARAKLAEGQFEEAVRLASECLDILPGNLDLATGIIPELDKAGHKNEADRLFDRVWGEYHRLIKKYPSSAWAHYNASWLASACLREPEAALELAKKAVELEPNVRSHQEALAEAHFRLDQRAEAVAVVQKLIVAEPKNFLLRRQLERYRTGKTDSPLPDGNED